MKRVFVAAALAAAWSGAADAQPSRHVRTHDLDLASPTGRTQLDQRIAAAARLVCVDRSSALYGSYAAARTCIQQTRQIAASQREAAIRGAKPVAIADRGS